MAFDVMITLNFDNFIRVITQIGNFDIQPILNSIIDIPLCARVVVNPKSIFIFCQLSVDKFQIIYVVAFWEYYEYLSIADDDIVILLRKVMREWGREKRMKLDYAMFLVSTACSLFFPDKNLVMKIEFLLAVELLRWLLEWKTHKLPNRI